MQVPNPVPGINAGNLPVQIVEACKICQAEPEALLSWALKPDAAVVILADGRKVTFPIVGRWINLPFPWAVDSPPAAEHMPAVGAFDYAERYPKEDPATVPLFEEPGAAPRPAVPPKARRKK